MKRHNGMASAVFSSRQADVADDANQPAAGNKGLEALLPDLVEFLEKLVVILDVT
jgi:hypothetical protein